MATVSQCELKQNLQLICGRCKATLETYDGISLSVQAKAAARSEFHAKSCPDVRIEAYIGEIFRKTEDVSREAVYAGAVAFPMRTFNLGKIVSHNMQLKRPDEPLIEEAQQTIADAVLVSLQSIFGTKPRGETFYWRERPAFHVWPDPCTRAHSVGLWLEFGLEGWTADETLAQYLGVSEETVSEIAQKGEFGGVNWLDHRPFSPE